jgi:TonB family protein
VLLALLAFLLSPPAAASHPCDRYALDGLALGMSPGTVKTTMGGNGFGTSIRLPDGEESTGVSYPGPPHDIYVEYDQRIDRRKARVVRVRVSMPLSKETVEALFRRFGQPNAGTDELNNGLKDGGSTVWIDDTCGLVLTAFRPSASWWAAEGGAQLQVETFELARRADSPAKSKLAPEIAPKTTRSTPAPSAAPSAPPHPPASTAVMLQDDLELPEEEPAPPVAAAPAPAPVPKASARKERPLIPAATPARAAVSTARPAPPPVTAVLASAEPPAPPPEPERPLIPAALASAEPPAPPPEPVPPARAEPAPAAVETTAMPAAPPPTPPAPVETRSERVREQDEPALVAVETPAKPAPATPAPARSISSWHAPDPQNPAPPQPAAQVAPQPVAPARVPASTRRPGGDAAAERIGYVEAVYPATAKWLGIKGHATLGILVQADGSVARSVSVIDAVPAGRGFEEASIDAVRKWRYQPATRGGRPVASRLTVTVDFE